MTQGEQRFTEQKWELFIGNEWQTLEQMKPEDRIHAYSYASKSILRGELDRLNRRLRALLGLEMYEKAKKIAIIVDELEARV